MSLRDLNQISIERGISKTSQKYFKSDVFFFDDYNTSQIHLKKDAFYVTSLRRLEHVSKICLFCDVSETSLKYIRQVFVTFHKKWFVLFSVELLKLAD